MTKYKWEFAERGVIMCRGLGSSYFGPTFPAGEYTTFIDAKTQMKKHVITELDYKKLHEHLADHGKKEYDSHFGHWSTKTRWVEIREKFIKKLNKKNLIIIDKEWLK